MEENLDELDYMIINVESCLNGSLKVKNFIQLIPSGYNADPLNKYAICGGFCYVSIYIKDVKK